MNDEKLKWETKGEEELLSTRVFRVIKRRELSPTGVIGDYIALDGPDCVVVIPETEGAFVTVRQWRHGSGTLTVEFPGGVVDRGEEPETAARRELEEETGCIPGKLTFLGECSPNPALFTSRLYFYLAEELTPTGATHPDPDELIETALVPTEEFIASFGNAEVTHAFTGTALTLYLRHKAGK